MYPYKGGLGVINMHTQEFHRGIKGNIISFYSCTEYSSGGATAIETNSRIIHTEFTDKLCLATACKSPLLNMFENTLWAHTFRQEPICGGRTCTRAACTGRSHGRCFVSSHADSAAEAPPQQHGEPGVSINQCASLSCRGY